MLGALNQVMVEGISVLNYVELPEDSENAMSMVAAADYEICFGKETFFTEEIQSLYHQFIDADSIEILKKTKKSEKVVDIKPLILESKIVKCQKSEDTVPGIFMKLTTGSVNNLKPELVIEAFLQFLAEQGIVDINSSQVDITGLLYVKRLEIYGFNQEQLQSLDSFGKEIL